MSPEDVVTRLESFVRTRFRVAPEDRRFSRHTNLWEDGYLDSIGVVELIAYLEESCRIELPDEVLFDPDFSSLDGIARIVCALAPARARPPDAFSA